MIYVHKSPMKWDNDSLVEQMRGNIRVGVEAEIISKKDRYFLNDSMTDGWQCGTDSSIEPEGEWRHTAELRSPVMTLAGAKAKLSLLDSLSSGDSKTTANHSCGFHVHVSLHGMTRNFAYRSPQERPSGTTEEAAQRDLKIFARCVALSQKHMFALCGAAGRKNRFTGSYCRPVVISRTEGSALLPANTEIPEVYRDSLRKWTTEAYNLSSIIDSCLGHDGNSSKYRHCTFHQFTSPNKGLFEVRAFSGTSKTRKAFIYSCMAASVLHKAASCTGGLEFPKPPDASGFLSKTGFTKAMEDFFEDMEWTRNGRRFGLPTALPYDLDEIKTELLRLAAKTDKWTPNMKAEDVAAIEGMADEPSERENAVPVPVAPVAGTNDTFRAVALGTADMSRITIPADPLNATVEQLRLLAEQVHAEAVRLEAAR